MLITVRTVMRSSAGTGLFFKIRNASQVMRYRISMTKMYQLLLPRLSQPSSARRIFCGEKVLPIKYMDLNFDGLKDSVIDMIGGKRCKVDVGSFQNDDRYPGEPEVLFRVFLCIK